MPTKAAVFKNKLDVSGIKCRPWYSAEDFAVRKVSKESRRNPRFPHNTMSKGYKINTPRPIGPSRIPSSLPCCLESKFDDFPDEVGSTHPWERLRNTFGSKPQHSNVNTTTPMGDFDGCRFEKPNETLGSYCEAKTVSSTAVQVSMFHCGDCRNHIKYGKGVFIDHSGNESDTESSGFNSDCISCNKGSVKDGKKCSPVELSSPDEPEHDPSLEHLDPGQTVTAGAKANDEDYVSIKEELSSRTSQSITRIIVFALFLACCMIFLVETTSYFSWKKRKQIQDMTYENWSDFFRIVHSSKDKPFFLAIFEFLLKKLYT